MSASSRSRKSLVGLAAILFLLLASNVLRAQHDASGGSTKDMVGGSVAGGTGRARPASKPASASTIARRRTPPPVRRTVTRGLTAEDYNRQGDEFYKANNYQRRPRSLSQG